MHSRHQCNAQTSMQCIDINQFRRFNRLIVVLQQYNSQYTSIQCIVCINAMHRHQCIALQTSIFFRRRRLRRITQVETCFDMFQQISSLLAVGSQLKLAADGSQQTCEQPLEQNSNRTLIEYRFSRFWQSRITRLVYFVNLKVFTRSRALKIGWH